MFIYSIFRWFLDQVTDFKSVNKKYGGLEAFQGFLNATKERKQNVVLELDPHFSSSSHNWFVESKNKNGQYLDYYIWRNASSHNGPSPVPPTKSENWEWNADRKQFYLYTKNNMQPRFNYRNPLVVEELKSIMGHWLNLGIKGFKLLGDSFLITEENGEADLNNNTRLNAELLKNLKAFVLNRTDNQGYIF